MCAEGRPDVGHGGNTRIFAGQQSDAYLVRNDVGQRGYCIVIWRGRHVADPTELTDADAAAYLADVLRVGRAIERQYIPIKMNLEILGNSVPHLHTHVVPRYHGDGAPGMPPLFMRRDPNADPQIPEDEYQREVHALRALLV